MRALPTDEEWGDGCEIVDKVIVRDLQAAVKQWTTPCAADSQGTTAGGKDPAHGARSLRADTHKWQTPGSDSFRSRSGNRKHEMGLDRQARTLWPTPTANDSESTGSRNTPGSEAHAGISLTDAATTGRSSGRPIPGNSTDGPRFRRRSNPQSVDG